MQKTEPSLFDYDPGNPLHRTYFAALNREWLERYFRVEDHDAEAFADPQGKVLAKDGIILFAQVQGEIVGTGSLLKMEKGVYEVAKMAVTERFQGRGIGERLLLALIARAREKKATRLFIVSNTTLASAIKLYRKHGFIDSAENRHHYYERGNITLVRPL